MNKGTTHENEFTHDIISLPIKQSKHKKTKNIDITLKTIPHRYNHQLRKSEHEVGMKTRVPALTTPYESRGNGDGMWEVNSPFSPKIKTLQRQGDCDTPGDDEAGMNTKQFRDNCTSIGLNIRKPIISITVAVTVICIKFI